MNHEIIMQLLQMRDQYQVLHWQTTSYARHKAYDKVIDAITDGTDKLVEACMGKKGRFEFPDGSVQIQIFNLKSLEINSFIAANIDFLMELNKDFDKTKDSDLLNIRDEILGEINKLKYLLTLN
jgi:Family of unknown function (DUF5856)